MKSAASQFGFFFLEKIREFPIPFLQGGCKCEITMSEGIIAMVVYSEGTALAVEPSSGVVSSRGALGGLAAQAGCPRSKSHLSLDRCGSLFLHQCRPPRASPLHQCTSRRASAPPPPSGTPVWGRLQERHETALQECLVMSKASLNLNISNYLSLSSKDQELHLF